MRGRNERGFSLLDVVVATALTTFVILALASAVAGAAHANALAASTGAMRADALDVLADLRAATAYDRAMLQSMEGRRAATTLARGNANERIIVRVFAERQSGAPQPGAIVPVTRTVDVAEVTVSALGQTIVERQTLYAEAPAPGSSVDQ